MKAKLESVLDLIRQAPVAAADETWESFKDRYHAWRTISAGVAIGHLNNLINSQSLTLRKVVEKELNNKQNYLLEKDGKFVVGEWLSEANCFDLGWNTASIKPGLSIYELIPK